MNIKKRRVPSLVCKVERERRKKNEERKPKHNTEKQKKGLLLLGSFFFFWFWNSLSAALNPTVPSLWRRRKGAAAQIMWILSILTHSAQRSNCYASFAFILSGWLHSFSTIMHNDSMISTIIYVSILLLCWFFIVGTTPFLPGGYLLWLG